MSANVIWAVKVLRTHEEVVTISAVTGTEAKDEAERLPGVISVVGIFRGNEYIKTMEIEC